MHDNQSERSRDLDERLANEARFHDSKYATGEEAYPRHYAVRPTEYVYERMRADLGDLRGMSVLEYGCGEGWITTDLVKMGAQVFAFDVSPTAIENTRSVLNGAGLHDGFQLDVMPAEQLTYESESIDVAVGFAIIHHLDLNKAFAELHRVLKPGGVAYFAEPLGTNPVIQLYRRMTPQYRTADERPLYLKEMPALLADFSSFSHKEFFVTATLAMALAYLPGGVKAYGPVSRFLHKVDAGLLRLAPSLGSWGWYSILKIVK